MSWLSEQEQKRLKEYIDDYNSVMIKIAKECGWSNYYHRNYDMTSTLTEIKKETLSEEKIAEILEGFSTKIPNDRKFVIYTGCRTRGGVMIGTDSGFIPCGDELCATCMSFHKAMEEAANNLYPNDKEK